MKKLISIIILFLSCIYADAQYTLDECQTLARENYPLIKQYELIEKSADYSIQNARRAWLPQISLSGQATYQSDVPSFPEEMTDLYDKIGISLHPLHNDQYRIALDINQTIWDGGYARSRREEAEADREVLLLSNTTELYALNERINQIYFGILTLGEQEQQAMLRESLLNENRKAVGSAAENGVATEGDLDLLDAELLVNKQYISRIRSSRKAYIQILSLMTGKVLGEDAVFEKPAVPSSGTAGPGRPELKLFEAQLNALESKKRAANSAVMPHFNFFAQGLYGNPGLNMFEDMMSYQWSWNYIVGIRFQWNISSFYTRKNNLRNIELSQNRVNVQRERFIYENNLQQSQTVAAIEQMKDIMSEDERIIELRTKVRMASEAKFRNGVITMSELLKDITNETNARLEKSINELEWLKKIYELKNIRNN